MLFVFQLLEWLEESKQFDFVERDYASRLDLVAKTRGLQEAENYIDEVPESFKGEVVYRTLLANCVTVSNVKKAEEVFCKMRDLGLPLSAFAYNQLLLLYRRINRRKIPDVLLMMEKDNVKPSLFTYMILIDAKGLAKNIAGMESILESMKTEGVALDNACRAMVAGHYISAGLNEKAEETLKDIELDFKENTDAWKFLLPLYAALHRVDDVKRVWKSCEAVACVDDFKAAIEACGKVGLVEDAEKVFEKMRQKWKKVPPRCYNALLNVYADHKLLSKGKDLARKMSEAGCWIGPLTWDALVKLFAKAGEVKKADSVLEIAVQKKGNRPLYRSYIALLEKYSEMGDVYNAEKIFHWLKEAEYPRRVRQYVLLAEAYKNAKAPAYGLRERMKAENVYPDKQFSAELQALANL
ncbi:Pentatricopeptide repeat-containing protein [Apostasia shenzhenica]|uniref:Pentatricopeptide repeat-containing protein n=1 Tax=Apostasia shenzhenica TaxID=1088818 RepID=A0A2H9ZVR9_9ASPA|nr:Pentatricopeptide repeat-containing protein [Apostasia shenzhenica]